MPNRRIETMNVREMLRYLREGESDRAIQEALGVHRKTVARYREWAVEQELLDGPLPPLGDLEQLLKETLNSALPPQNESSVEPYRDFVAELLRQGVEIAAIYARLQDEKEYSGSYSAVWRFARKLKPIRPKITVRIETKPGEEIQVDFGFVGMMIDPETGELRKVWVFVMLLSWSRHMYVEFVFDQTIATWLRLHRNGFAFLGGVTERVVIDNLKAGIAKACWHEPQAQLAYRECAEHYGFLISPCRPRTPQHKGKVEKGGIHYVKRNFLAGRPVTTITQANRDVLRWVQTTAGQRIHGTTKERPLDRFEIEKPALRPLPPTPYDLAIWKQVKLHRDCHIVFEQSYYSAPFGLVGQQLWVRGGVQTVQIFTNDYQLVTTHTRAQRPGQRVTKADHLPPEKLPGLLLTRDWCRQQADQIGLATRKIVDLLLEHRPEDRLRTAGRLLRLADRFGPERLENACLRALCFADPSYMTVKGILEQKLDVEELLVPESPPPATVFARDADELFGHFPGGGSWN